ncbi:MAG: carbonic anhydrase [Bacteroidetes bacterium]|nr:carbonic anhydrase [Bacteroidota bacterium]MBL6942724.1 carbonic anhydrase [Bacteroidales bacterium]
MLTENAASYSEMTPHLAIEILKEGNKRFADKKMLERDLPTEVKLTSNGQHPFAVVLNCMDSRVPAELIFDQGIGDIFNTRIAGNIINDDIIGSMEFACKIAGAKLIIVLGHTSCGAVKGACDRVKLGKLTGLLKKLEPAIITTITPKGTDRSSENNEFVNRVAQKNVELTIENIKNQSPVLNMMIENHEIKLVGAIYDISNGVVEF